MRARAAMRPDRLSGVVNIEVGARGFNAFRQSDAIGRTSRAASCDAMTES
jgi:hypothetical protein